MDIKKDKGKLFFIIVIITCLLFGAYFIYTQFFSTSSPRDLFEDYDTMSDAIGDPVSNPTIPTISEVVYWLANEDTTDRIPYDEESWICSDYSTTLLINAKEENWRMYIVILYYSYDDDDAYGENTPYGEFGHVFNMIYCQDANGDGELDIWYIEPQSDGFWQLSFVHYNIYTYYVGTVSSVWSGMYWVNYYFYFG